MRLLLLLLSISLSLLSPSVQAAFVPEPPKLNASGYLLIDAASGQTLVAHGETNRLEPASLTKIMTAYVVFHELREQRITLKEKVRVSVRAWRTPGSRMFIKEGSRVSVEDLLKGMIIQSGNDASVALAEYVGGSEGSFASLMNDHAANLGMASTNFMNSTGLPDPNHYTTPEDIAILSRAMILHFPQYYKWYAQKEFTYNKISQNNRNLLLFRDKSVDGLKTGHTEAAGYCLVASAKRNDMRLISVVMGTKSARARADESQKLLNYGFRFYESHRLYGGMETLKDIRIWQGSHEMLRVGVAEELFITVPRGQYENLKANLIFNRANIAPVAKGEVVGEIDIRLDGEKLAAPKLIALDEIAKGSLFQQLKDKLLMMIE